MSEDKPQEVRIFKASNGYVVETPNGVFVTKNFSGSEGIGGILREAFDEPAQPQNKRVVVDDSPARRPVRRVPDDDFDMMESAPL